MPFNLTSLEGLDRVQHIESYLATIGAAGTDVMWDGFGFKSMNFVFQNIATQAQALSGTVYAIALPLKEGQVASNLVLDVEVAGTGAAPTGFFVGLADGNGKMLTQSGNLSSSTSLTTQSLSSFPFNSAYQVPSSGVYYGIFLENGSFASTACQFGRGTGRFSFNGKFYSCTAGSGQSSLPNNGSSLAAYSGTGALDFWIGVS
jgi:hypothetical protein